MRKISDKSKTRRISLVIPIALLHEIDKYVEFSNRFDCRSEFIRHAVGEEVKKFLEVEAQFAMQKAEKEIPW